MSKEIKRTYVPFTEFAEKSKQTEYTAKTTMLAKDGTLLAKGFAKRNVFDYDRDLVHPKMRRKEWDFYQLSNGKYMVQISFTNISLGGYASAVLVDIQNGKTISSEMALYLGKKDKYVLPPKGDVPHRVEYSVGKSHLVFDVTEKGRTLYFKYKDVECNFTVEHLPYHENITTILPFKEKPTRYFMTTKQNCMPCEGTFKCREGEFVFSKEDTFCVLDWGRVNTPYRLVWYWGNGSTYVLDSEGKKHTFGFEITWGIGDESNATETCLFYDGKAMKIGAVDVKEFPKPDKYMQDWVFVSEDGRFNLTMKPFYDHHSDLNVAVMRMHSHQVHGLWYGNVILDDGTKLEINDMYAFCEYVENKW